MAYRILIISSSIRPERMSHRVTLFLESYLKGQGILVDILDLREKNYPMFHERLKNSINPTESEKEISDIIGNAQGIIIVTPEYNGGYPASLKNIIDFLKDEWYHKPIALAPVSSGSFGGLQCITSLEFTLWKLQALVATVVFPVANVEDTFDEHGTPKDEATTHRRAEKFIQELYWMIEMKTKMDG